VSEKKLWIEISFSELRDDLILLEITNFHKYIGSLANEMDKCSQIETRKRQEKGHAKEESIKTLIFTANVLSIC